MYLHLTDRGIVTVDEFHIPRFLNADEILLVIEMTIVRAPYILGFAGARLDAPLRFEPEILEMWEEQKREEFEGDWKRVKRLLAKMAGLGVFLSDVHPGNVRCR